MTTSDGAATSVESRQPTSPCAEPHPLRTDALARCALSARARRSRLPAPTLPPLATRAPRRVGSLRLVDRLQVCAHAPARRRRARDAARRPDPPEVGVPWQNQLGRWRSWWSASSRHRRARGGVRSRARSCNARGASFARCCALCPAPSEKEREAARRRHSALRSSPRRRPSTRVVARRALRPPSV